MSKPTLDKAYNPAAVEDKWYDHWSTRGYFHADAHSEKEPYTIVIPPPNVTGMLSWACTEQYDPRYSHP